MEIKFIKPNHDLMLAIAGDMRDADAEEVWASDHHTPIEALQNGFNISDYSAIVMVNDEPCVMLGLVIHDILSGLGSPWLLGTNNALKYKRYFLTEVDHVIDDMLSICPKLFNYVHTDNRISKRWLKRIGFTIDEPLPYGIDDELFHKFYLERF